MAKTNQLLASVQPGNEYGDLTVVKVFREQVKANRCLMARCVYPDGTYKDVRAVDLYSGKTKGLDHNYRMKCGGISVKYLHTYISWDHMIDRCTNPKNRNYRHYGGRGIKVCDRWRESFPAFLEDMGERPKGLTIDRIDNDGNYEPGNCKWATRKEQSRNRRSQRIIEHNGKRLCVSEWAERLQIPANILSMRLYLGWDTERALTTPVRKLRRTKRLAEKSV